MGSTIGSHKIEFPFGSPPCAENLHHHAHIALPPPAPIVPDLQARVSSANKYVEDEFQALVATRYKMKEQVRRSMEDWKKIGGPLIEECKNTREGLVKLGEEGNECQNAQDAALPKLFQKRSDVPKTLKQFAKIKGCANFKETNNVEEVADCRCATGSEKDGCKDNYSAADHKLLCTHLRQKVLPNLQLWRLTAPGGACFVNASTPFNKGMLPAGVPADFEIPGTKAQESSVPAALLALEPLRPMGAAADESSQKRHSSDIGKAFL